MFYFSDDCSGKLTLETERTIMKAYVIHEFGGIDKLKLEEVEKPTPTSNEAVIAVKAIGMNTVDYEMRQGDVLIDNLRFPVILGCDIAGVVETVGTDVTNIKVGDRVAGLINFPHKDGTWAGRAYAEYVAAPADQLAVLQPKISFKQGAAFSLVALAVKQALFDRGNLQAGQKVLIHGASGGVGHIAVQLAKNRGAYVVATASEKQKAFVRNLGADEIIDYKNEKFEDIVQDIDVVLNTIYGDIASRSIKVLKSGGTLISLLPLDDTTLQAAAVKHLKAEFMLVRPSGQDLAELLFDMSSGKLQAHIGATYPFVDLAASHTAMQKGGIPGKIIVVL